MRISLAFSLWKQSTRPSSLPKIRNVEKCHISYYIFHTNVIFANDKARTAFMNRKKMMFLNLNYGTFAVLQKCHVIKFLPSDKFTNGCLMFPTCWGTLLDQSGVCTLKIVFVRRLFHRDLFMHASNQPWLLLINDLKPQVFPLRKLGHSKQL